MAFNTLSGNFLDGKKDEAFTARYLDEAMKIYPCVTYEEDLQVSVYLSYLSKVLGFIRSLGNDYRFLSKVVEKIDKLD